MTITITMDLTEANLEKLKALLPEGSLPVKTQPKTQKGTSETKQLPGQTSMFDGAPVESGKPEEPKEQLPFDVEPAAPTPTITKSDVRAVALALSKAGKQAEIAAAFGKFGAKKLSDFDAMPEKYPALMQELKNING